LLIVVDSISFQLPIAQLPISAVGSFGAGLSSAARAAGVAGGFGGVAAGGERGVGRGVAVW